MTTSMAASTTPSPRRPTRAACVIALTAATVTMFAGQANATTTTVGPTASTTPVLPEAAVPVTTVAPVGSTAASGEWAPPAVTVVAAARNRITPAYETATSTKPIAKFDNKLNFSGRHVFLVLAQEGNSYKVKLPMRPNGRVGYVKVADVSVYQHDYAIKVDLSDHVLQVFKGGKEIQRDVVAVGQAKYPTPTGSYFLRELAKPGNPKGSYGPWAFGLSAYSNVLQKFGRGDGQIGIHGTNQPGALGTNASHGCIRMKNTSITKLAQTLPQGVPIDIVA
jgi:hypothetical protein